LRASGAAATIAVMDGTSDRPEPDSPAEVLGIPLRRTRPSRFWRWFAVSWAVLGVVSVIGHLRFTAASSAVGVVTALLLDRELRRRAERQPRA
jgi:hypothetical protein